MNCKYAFQKKMLTGWENNVPKFKNEIVCMGTKGMEHCNYNGNFEKCKNNKNNKKSKIVELFEKGMVMCVTSKPDGTGDSFVKNIDNRDIACYANNQFRCKTELGIFLDSYIQWIAVVNKDCSIKKIFDRKMDLQKFLNKPMPKLESGMFVETDVDGKICLGYIDKERNAVIYEDGEYDIITENYFLDSIIKIYGKETMCFKNCLKNNIIWEKTNI